MTDHEQRMEERRQSDQTCLCIELIRAATALIDSYHSHTIQDDDTLKAAKQFLYAYFTPTIVSYQKPLGEPTQVDVEKLKEKWERYKGGKHPYTPDMGRGQ